MISFSLALSSTIIGGSLIAERGSYLVYAVYSSLYMGVIFPLGLHWAWHNEGWLKELGFVDFSGAAFVHISGASAGLGALLVMGSRK